MLRIFTVILLMAGAFLAADEPSPAKLVAPAGWGGETIQLPPGFSPEMKLKDSEHIRFAPGMMDPESDTFFSYAFVFELEPMPVLTAAVVKDEFLKYYRGLCKAVLNGKLPQVDRSKFTLELQRARSDATMTLDDRNVDMAVFCTGTLEWVEPFATKNPQTLNLDIQTWTRYDRSERTIRS